MTNSVVTTLYARVIVELSIEKALDYQIPTHLVSEIQRGSCVEVHLRSKKYRGYVIDITPTTSVSKTAEILRVIGDEPILTPELFDLALWMAKYYMAPLGKVIKTLVPAGVRQNTQLKQQYFVSCKATREELRNAYCLLAAKAPQQAAVIEIMLRVKKGILQTELLEQSQASPSVITSLVEKGLLQIESVRTDHTTLLNHEYFRAKPKELRVEQALALQAILTSLDRNEFATHLLYGVTGSGKTEVYLQAIQHALNAHKNILMLVPEISLTEQTIERLRSRFDAPLAILHHRLSDGERKDNWDSIRDGNIPIVIGARSAVFSPLPKLGLLIVDEEHEGSYKQSDDSPCYNARDIAILRAQKNNATIILGSATPSIESYYHAKNGKYQLNVLKDRGEQSLPTVLTVDMRHEFEKAKGFTIFSGLLLEKIKTRKERGEQTILFLNRRGYHTTLMCQNCGKSIMCPHCDTKLTFHQKNEEVLCHLCGYSCKPSHSCPNCKKSNVIKYQGIGTEKVESILKTIFPELRTMRIDQDTTRHKGSLEMLLQAFRSGKADLLIGTQMIAKGLHFPEVTLVGVLNADSSLHIPDFRAGEQVFQLITQVSGRSGRGLVPGEVVVQTLLPEHSTILHATSQNYTAFFDEEIENRKLFGFPPLSRLVKILFVGSNEERVIEQASLYQQTLITHLSQEYTCHPVVPAGHVKIKDLYRYQFLVRGSHTNAIRQAILETDKAVKLPSTVQRFIDVDPLSTFF